MAPFGQGVATPMMPMKVNCDFFAHRLYSLSGRLFQNGNVSFFVFHSIDY